MTITWLALVAVFAAGVHGLAYVYMRSPASPDAAEYVALGKSLATRGELVLPTGERAKRMPAYPWLISLFYHGQSDEKLENQVLAAQWLLAVAVSILLAVISWRLADLRAGILAGMTSALYAPHLYLQTLCLSETLLIFFLVIALASYLFFLTLENPAKWAALILAGIALAAAAITRANAAVLALPFALDAALRHGPPKIRSLQALILLLPAALALMGWGMRNKREIGDFKISTIGGLNFYLGHNEHYAHDPGLANADYAAFDRLRRETGAPEIEIDRMLFSRGKQFAGEHPREELINVFRKIAIYHTSTTTTAAPSLLVLLLGMIVWTGRRTVSHPPVQRTFLQTTRIALLGTGIIWIAVFWQTLRPWINPPLLVPLGIVSMILLKTRLQVRLLFIALYLSELLVAISFIPLERLRWTVDFLLILSIAVALSRICRWLESD